MSHKTTVRVVCWLHYTVVGEGRGEGGGAGTRIASATSPDNDMNDMPRQDLSRPTLEPKLQPCPASLTAPRVRSCSNLFPNKQKQNSNSTCARGVHTTTHTHNPLILSRYTRRRKRHIHKHTPLYTPPSHTQYSRSRHKSDTAEKERVYSLDQLVVRRSEKRSGQSALQQSRPQTHKKSAGIATSAHHGGSQQPSREHGASS